MTLLVSADVNGHIVHPHTMSEMIRLYLGEAAFKDAKRAFDLQTDGNMSIPDAFSIAGKLTKGLTLRDAILYARDVMEYVDGFDDFVNSLERQGHPFVLNSTGYDVTMHVMRHRFPSISGHIGNRLLFGYDRNPETSLSESELQVMVNAFMGGSQGSEYDRIAAVGEVELGIADEADKFRLLCEFGERCFPEIPRERYVHMGDSFGDGEGALQTARAGGIGIAFNYKPALEDFLRENMRSGERIYLIDPKGPESSFTHVLEQVPEFTCP